MAKNVALFLKSEPPEVDDLIRDLFADRDNELRQAKAQIASCLETQPRQVLAVVGQARVGKSHLLRRVVQEVAPLFNACVNLRITQGHRDSKVVLRALLEQVRDALKKAVARVRGEQEVDQIFSSLDTILSKYKLAIDGAAAKLTLAEASSTANALKSSAGVKAKFGNLLTNLVAGLEGGIDLKAERERTRTEGATRTVEIAPFDDGALADLTALGHQLVRDKVTDWKTLIVVDDFDLLKRDESHAFDPMPLLLQLFRLSGGDGLFVLTTVREDTYEMNAKSFHRVTHADAFADDKFLRQVFDRHVALFHDGEDPFAGGWVGEVLPRCLGIIGVFLGLMRDAYEAVDLDSALIEKGMTSWLRSRWDQRAESEKGLADLLRKAAKEKNGYIDGEDVARVRRSGLRNFVLEDNTSEYLFRLNPVIHSILRETSQ